MNNKIRFVVFTFLAVVLLPATLLVVFILWLTDELGDMRSDYRKFYQRAWMTEVTQ